MSHFLTKLDNSSHSVLLLFCLNCNALHSRLLPQLLYCTKVLYLDLVGMLIVRECFLLLLGVFGTSMIRELGIGILYNQWNMKGSEGAENP